MGTDMVGFVGLGGMGAAMARRLVEAGYALRVWNRTAEKARQFADENDGVTVCETPGEAAQGTSFVVTMLADDNALSAVTTGDEGLLTALSSNAIHLSMSTIGAESSRHLSQLHDLHDAHYLAAPVFGRPEAAAAGKLNIVLSGGSAAVREQAKPVLEAMGQKVWDFGDDPGAANVVKLCGNFLLLSATEAMAEAFTLAEKGGVERQAIFEMLTQTIFNAPIYHTYGKMVASEDFSNVGFSLPLGLKDIRLVADTGRQTHTPLPLAALIEEKLTASVAKGRDHLDTAAFALESSEAAGLRRNETK